MRRSRVRIPPSAPDENQALQGFAGFLNFFIYLPNGDTEIPIISAFLLISSINPVSSLGLQYLIEYG
jgi:hypothetical protein